MSKKDQEFLKQLYQIYPIIVIITGIIMTPLFITAGNLVVYHFSLAGVFIWLLLSFALSPLFLYTKGLKQISENFLLSDWRRGLFFFFPILLAFLIGIVVAQQESRESVKEYSVGISFVDYQRNTFKPLDQTQTSLLAEMLKVSKESLIDEKNSRYYLFYKSSCPYCKVGMTSLIKKLTEEKKADIIFINLNFKDADKIAEALEVDKAGIVVEVKKVNGEVTYKSNTIAFDDEKGGIVTNDQFIEELTAEEGNI